MCGIPEKLLPSLESDFLHAEDKEQDIRLGSTAYAQALKRYHMLVATVPKALQPALLYNGKSWFERFVFQEGGRKKKAAGIEDDPE